MPTPIKHHYVPQHVLRRFRGPKGVLWAYDKKAKKIYKGNPASLGFVKRYYSFETANGIDDTTIEVGFMNRIDSDGSPAIEVLLRREKMTDQQAIGFMRFSAAQMLRVETHFQRLETTFSATFQEMATRMGKYDSAFREQIVDDLRARGADKAEVTEFVAMLDEGAFEVAADRSFLRTIFLSTLDDITSEFCQMNWTFLDTGGAQQEFVISDSPLVLEDVGEGPAQPLGIKNPNIQITMPLSPTMVAVAQWTGECSFGSLSSQSIETINQRTIDRANRFVYASYESEDLLDRVVESQGRQAQTITKRVEKDGKLLMISAYVG